MVIEQGAINIDISFLEVYVHPAQGKALTEPHPGIVRQGKRRTNGLTDGETFKKSMYFLRRKYMRRFCRYQTTGQASVIRRIRVQDIAEDGIG